MPAWSFCCVVIFWAVLTSSRTTFRGCLVINRVDTTRSSFFHSLVWRFPKDTSGSVYNQVQQSSPSVGVPFFPDEFTVESDGLSYDWNNRNLCLPILPVSPIKNQETNPVRLQMTPVDLFLEEKLDDGASVEVPTTFPYPFHSAQTFCCS